MPLRKLALDTALLLDRPGTRGILSSLLPRMARSDPSGVRELRYDRGWNNRFDWGWSIEPLPRMRSVHLQAQAFSRLWGFLYMPRTGDTIVDVGAGLGAEAVYCAQAVGPTGHVISIEAHPAIADYLRRTVEKNKYDQVSVLNLAAADKPGTLYIEDNLDHHLGNALTSTQEGLPVEAVTLDRIFADESLKKVDFLKMNIEGAEKMAIEGADTMLQHTAIICISCHDFKHRTTGNEFFITKDFVKKFVEDRGFVIVPRPHRVEEVVDQINAYNPKFVKPEDLLMSNVDF